MIRTTLALLAALVILPASAPGASGPARKVKAAVAKEKFYVYGGSCSRSIGLRGTYETIEAAFAAAEKFRTKDKLKWVTVRTGKHDKDYFGGNPTQYKVYRRGCRGRTWILHATAEKADKAKEVVEKLRKDAVPVEVVGHYAGK
jgi:hypothetical protein